MDIFQYNTRVVQEPRGMIRIITLIFAILAFATTSGFDSKTEFKLTCKDVVAGPIQPKTLQVLKYEFPVEYPFEFEKSITVRENCSTNVTQTHDYSQMDFSSSAQFYVATGVLSFLYSTAALVLYVFGSRHYESNPLIPVIDLGITAILAIFWLAGSSAWAAGVSDVKYYTSPEYLWSFLKFCGESNFSEKDENKPGYCLNSFPGKFTSLNISLIFGFANIFLWAASAWFVFKETQFHRKPIPEQMPGVPGQQSFDQFGGQMGGQQQMPGQTNFPQQRQFSDGY